jgi:hypothetical protein
MFKRILLPLDLTERQRAIDIAVELAHESAGEVILVHAIGLVPGVSMNEENDFYARLHKIATAHLERIGHALTLRDVRWRSHIVYGNRAAEIARHVTGESADLIILTAPRFDAGNPAASWSSLSWKTAIIAACPVLLVK